MNNALEGLRVIEGSAFVAAPSGGMTLAQLGADVIRFDPIGGGLDRRRWPLTPEGHSLYWSGLNKGKRSLRVDVRSPAGRELVSSLICEAGADRGIFLTNFPAQGWLGYKTLSQRRADLIMLAITGNHDGTSAVDYTVNCAMGYPFVTGHQVSGEASDTERPVNHVLPAWDLICGQTAALGLLAGERRRSRTGEGSYITLALSDVALAAVSALGHVYEAQVLGSERERIGNDLYGALGRDFQCADGRRVIAVAITPKQWRALCAACEMDAQIAALEAELGVDLSVDEGERFKARERIFALVEDWCSDRSLKEAAEAFEHHGVCWGPYRTFRQLLEEDPRCSTENPLFSQINQPQLGEVLAARSPLRFKGMRLSEPEPAPLLGQHTDEILAESLGLSAPEIGRLHDEGVVAGTEVAAGTELD